MSIKVTFPQGQIIENKNGKAQIIYNKNYVNKFNNDLNKTQVYLDNLVVTYLQEYVSYKSGTQAKSIILASDVGSGQVNIAVPYAEYQAYSKRIKKRVGLRGTQPFERMKSDKKDSILRQVTKYAERLNK